MSTSISLLSSLAARLHTLQETNTTLQSLIQRLATLRFQPGSIPLPDSGVRRGVVVVRGETEEQDGEDDWARARQWEDAEDAQDGEGNVATQLADEINLLLKEQTEDWELLRQELSEVVEGRRGGEREIVRQGLVKGVEREGKVLKSARTSFRHAQLSARTSLENAQRLERALLLASFRNPPPTTTSASTTTSTATTPDRHTQRSNPRTSRTKEEATLAASSDVTLALRRTHALMSSELARSQFAHDTLAESTAALTSLGERYAGLDGLLKKSRGLVGLLLRSQKSDTWYLETAFWILVATIAWLVFRRWVYGPAWWLVWVPLKIVWGAWMRLFTVVGLRGAVANGLGGSAAGEGALTGVGATGSQGVVWDAGAIPVSSQRLEMDAAASAAGGLVEEVGRIIDESRKEGLESSSTTDNDDTGTEDESQPNPLKRAWDDDEDVQGQKRHEERRVRDEL